MGHHSSVLGAIVWVTKSVSRYALEHGKGSTVFWLPIQRGLSFICSTDQRLVTYPATRPRSLWPSQGPRLCSITCSDVWYAPSPDDHRRYTFHPTMTTPRLNEGKIEDPPPPSGTSSATRADLGVLAAAVELRFSESASRFVHAEREREEQAEPACHLTYPPPPLLPPQPVGRTACVLNNEPARMHIRLRMWPSVMKACHSIASYHLGTTRTLCMLERVHSWVLYCQFHAVMASQRLEMPSVEIPVAYNPLD